MLVCVQVSVPLVSTPTMASSPACSVHLERTNQRWGAPPASPVEGTWTPGAAGLSHSRSVRPKVGKILVMSLDIKPNNFCLVYFSFRFSLALI